MSSTPNPNNYTLGKGVVSFNRKDATTGLFTGERDLGNTPSFSFSVSTNKLAHYSSRGGLKAKDKEVVSEMTPSLKFSLDEINTDNFAMLAMGSIESVSQVAASVIDEVVTAHVGRMSSLSKRKIGSTTLSHGTVTNGPFVVGETVTGGTSTATGKIIAVGAGFIRVAATGTFQNAETITVTTKTATLNAAPVFVAGVIKVTNTAGTTTYVQGTDYDVTVSLKDDIVGRLRVLEGGTIVDATDLKVTYGCSAYTYKAIHGLKEYQISGFLRFVSDNPAGTNRELQVWSVSLVPSGDTAMIGDDWATISFEGEILKDEVNHPSSPYFDVNEL